MVSLEERFNKLKEVMINNLEQLHDIIIDGLDESEEYYDAFEKDFDVMIENVRVI